MFSSTTGKFDARIGLFPGTFDPIHLGHVEIARIAQTRLGLNAVIFIPNYNPPHKHPVNPAPSIDRYCMVQLAVLDIKNFFVSDYEVESGGISYTINTVKYFSGLYPTCDLRLLVGSDSLREMHSWFAINEYAGLVSIVGISRKGEIIKPEEINLPDGLKANLKIIEGINMPQSSTEIKDRIRRKSDLDGFLDPLVERYIMKYELYQ
jgi:nicotinate-nucleotide adenylyltransferase